MAKKINGCVHLIIKNSKLINIFTHLDEIPKNGVVHLKGDKIYSYDEFRKSHIHDHNELNFKPKKPNKGLVLIK